MTNSASLADPIVTANIYASGLVDDLLQYAILPFWRDLRITWPEDCCYLWTMRYARGGEHLKVRVHGEAGAADSIRTLLRQHVEPWIAKVQALPPVDTRVSNPKALAIDVEDKAEVPFPDRTFVSTTYARTYVSLPGSPWIEDDDFVALACRSLSGTTGVLLTSLGRQVPLSGGDKQTLLAKSLISALAAAGLGSRDSALEYLSFHRDWLLRFFIPETAKELEIRTRFDVQAAQSGATAALARLSEQGWRLRNSSEGEPWLQSLAALTRYTQSFAGQSHYQIDPFTSNITFPPLFKMLHGMANQFGVTPLHEAYVHHLLINAVENHIPACPRELITV
jgi:hypothetical protein